MADLPFIDDHHIRVAAPAGDVWAALGRHLAGAMAANNSVVVALLSARPPAAHGDPLQLGSALSGFAVTAADPQRRLELTGQHRFSQYQLVFTLTTENNDTGLSARSSARFPGLLGCAYRALVVGSGGHRVVVSRMIRTIARSAEKRGARALPS
ncbi:MAG: hypothetical protein M3Y26_02725 [Actinomycetota bacterium]|nr:hypothetical protein [Actinomycetota bacterium]